MWIIPSVLVVILEMGVCVLIENLEEAFDEIYHDMFPKLKRIALLKFRDEFTAEDLAQDTLLVAYLNRKKVLMLPNLKKWIYGVLQNKIKHELRSKARFTILKNKLERYVQEDQQNGEDGYEELLEGLSSNEYNLLHMIYVEGFNNIEAAVKLNISYAACRKQVQRAKEKIRQRIGENKNRH